jgi:CHRD domain-containing protein
LTSQTVRQLLRRRLEYGALAVRLRADMPHAQAAPRRAAVRVDLRTAGDDKQWRGSMRRSAKALAIVLSAGVLGGVGLGVALAKNGDKVSASLNAKQELPKQVFKRPNATGTFTGTMSRRKLTWKMTFKGMSGPVVAAHIHIGKKGKANPAPAVALCGPCKNGQTGKVTIPDSVERVMDAGGAYVNVHTAKNQAGEIRGQIVVTHP